MTILHIHTFSLDFHWSRLNSVLTLQGKSKGVPVWKILQETYFSKPKQEHHIVPYASLQPAGSTLEEYRASLVSWALKAKKLGFKAAKLEATLTGLLIFD